MLVASTVIVGCTVVVQFVSRIYKWRERKRERYRERERERRNIRTCTFV